jgi:lysylphosphatidylglycerol synthetase-like protein (DUF2156 family)
MRTTKHVSTVLALVASTICIGGLLPLAFGVSGMTTAVFPLGNAVFFLVIMGGPLLLLASGFQSMVGRFFKRWFLVAFAGLLVIVGLALFWKLPGHGLLLDWMAMSLVIVLIAAALRRGWLWAVVGGAWTCVLLAVMLATSTIAFLSPAARGTPTWAPLWLLGCILALASGIVAFMRRNEAY